MKKAVFLSFAALSAMAMQAKTVTAEQALTAAQQFRQAQVAQGVMAAPMKADMKLAYTAENAEFYVFNGANSTGYVIVAGDDCAPTILGYSDKGNFDSTNMPPAMKAWLKSYERQVAFSAKSGIAYAPATTPDHAKIAPMVTTQWNQGAPYNDMCPYNNTEKAHAATGCVATAMAQVANYHKWPTQAQGTGSATFAHKTITRDMSNDVFAWDKMLNKYATKTETDSSGTTEQREAVALLMLDMGHSVNMSYAVSASGASSPQIPVGLIKYLNYDKAAHLVYRSWYTDAQWDSIIYNELANGRPVLYSGDTKAKEGHEFVCHGYEGNGYYYFNWGWGGMSDGIFLLSALNPKIQGTGGSSRQLAFDYNQDAVLGVQKPVEGSDYHWQFMLMNSIEPYVHPKRKTVFLNATTTNISATTFKGELGLRAVNTATNEVSYIKYRTYSSLGIGSSLQYYPDTLLNRLGDGVFKVGPAFRPDNGEWTMPEGDKDYEKEILVTIKDGVKTYSIDDTLKVYGVTINDALLFRNKSTDFSITFSTNGAEYTTNINYKLVDKTTNSTIYTSDAQTLTIDAFNAKSTCNFKTPEYDFDTTHYYQLEFYENGKNLIIVSDSLKATEFPVFEIIEPLKASNLENGILYSDTGYKLDLTMKVINKHKSSFNGYNFNVVTIDDGHTITTNFRYAIADYCTIKGDTIEMHLKDFSCAPMSAPDVEGKLTLTVPITNNLLLSLTPAENATLSFKTAVRPTGIEDATDTAATIVKSEVYNLQGICVAKQNGKASLNGLGSGIYIVKSTDSNGDISTYKTIVK